MNVTHSGDDASTPEPRIEARLVPTEHRAAILPKHFGPRMLTVESAIFDFMRRLVPEYHGAYWNFYELTNGGFYMAPHLESAQLHVQVETNGYEGHMSADAAGMTACLFAFSHLSFHYTDDLMGHHYHLLREFIATHPEAAEILAACD